MSDDAGKQRAGRIREQIEKLRSPSSDKNPEPAVPPARPRSPRELIEEKMRKEREKAGRTP